MFLENFHNISLFIFINIIYQIYNIIWFAMCYNNDLNISVYK